MFGYLNILIRYKRLKRFLPKVIKENNLDPTRTYLVSKNSSTYINLISFTENGIRQIIITNYWVRKLSLLDMDLLLKYTDIDYVIRVPYLHFSLVLKDEIKSIYKNPLFTGLSADMPFAYPMDKHTLFNFSWFKGYAYKQIVKELAAAKVTMREKSEKQHARRNNLIMLIATIIIVAFTAVYLALIN